MLFSVKRLFLNVQILLFLLFLFSSFSFLRLHNLCEFSCLSTTLYTETSNLLLALKMFPYNSETHFFLDALGWPKNMQRAMGACLQDEFIIEASSPPQALHTTTFTYKLSNGRHHHQAYIFHPCRWRPRENRARIEE